MIVLGTFILVLFLAGLYLVWADLSALIDAQLDEIGAGVEDGLDTCPPVGATATLTAAGAETFSETS